MMLSMIKKQSACRVLGLIEDDKEIDEIMENVTSQQFGNQVRDFLLLFHSVADRLLYSSCPNGE